MIQKKVAVVGAWVTQDQRRTDSSGRRRTGEGTGRHLIDKIR